MNATTDTQPVVTITAEALGSIAEHVRDGGRVLETGGILLGHTRDQTTTVVVAGGPGPNALRTPDRFSRDRAYAETLADQAWRDQGAEWVGEWHTHPAGSPIPSDVDLASYRRHLDDQELGFDRFVSLVAAVPPYGNPVLACWVIESDAVHPVALQTESEVR